jgi:hypothetical protein
MYAINAAIKIEFPTSVQDCAVAASGFENISFRGILKNVVGVLDGYLLHIITPKKQTNRNVRSYFSGHYQKYGINIQACCNANSRFIFLGVGGPGVIMCQPGYRVCKVVHHVFGIFWNYFSHN